VHALVGENGAGKSTLIKIMTGAERADGGALVIDGVPVVHIDPHTTRALGIAAIYQQPALFPDLTVAENVALSLERGSSWRRIDRHARRRRASELLQRIGVTLDPNFAENGYLYVVSVRGEPYPHHRISRFTAVGDTAASESELVLFEGDDQTKLGGQVPAGHQGGAIHFGADGKLYVAIGEQTAEQPAQSLDTLQGKILRLNSDGTIPTDNPFFDEAKGKYRSIWALGCRNPYTFAIDGESGQMLINDVGGKYEEINQGRAGANYGWPAADHGPTADARYQGPVFWYPQASICGGAFCPASDVRYQFPVMYRGRYFFMDFVQGWIKTLDPMSLERPVPAEAFATGLARPVDLSFAADGSLYVLLRNAWVKDAQFKPGTGSLHRIRPSPGF